MRINVIVIFVIKMVKIKCCRSQVETKNLWVSSHDKLSDFYASSWQKGDSPIPLLVVRIVALLVIASVLAWTIYEGFNWYWLLFLTNWGLILITAMFINGVAVSIAAMNKTLDEGELPWYFSLYWLLHNITVTVSLMISALFWVLLYNPDVIAEEPPRLWVLDVLSHGMNAVVVFLEVLFSRTPVHLVHFYQPLGVGVWYGVFTWIYYIAGGTDAMGDPYIYEILDWRYSKRCLVIIGISAVGLLGIYCLVYGFALCRDKLTNSIFRTTTVKLAYVPPDVTTMPNTNNLV